MNKLKQDQAQSDSAWASIPLKINRPWLNQFCENTERLFRINPQYEIHRWEKTANNQYHLEGFNHSNQQSMDTWITVVSHANRQRFNYASGIKAFTDLEITAEGMKITDDYNRLHEDERRKRLHEVDRSLIPWAHALRRHIIWRRRLQWIPFWSFYLDRVWYQMRPSNRRIANILIWLTVAEFIIFLVLIAVYVNIP